MRRDAPGGAGGEVVVRPGPVSGTVRAPGSKSVTHRAYVLAAQSDQPCTVRRPLRAADPDATLACLHAFGARVSPEPEAVRFDPAPLLPPRHVLDCRNAGTGLRLLTALAARLPFPVALDGDASLRRRPNGPLLDALAGLGARVAHQDGRCPYTVQGPVHAGEAALPARASSQYASALLLMLPLLDGDSTLRLAAPVASRPYLDVTARTAGAAGLSWREGTADDDGLRFDVPGGQVPRAPRLDVEGDWSAAAFFLVAGAVAGGPVTVEGLDPQSAQGDRAVVDALRAFGARVDARDDAVVATAPADGLASPGTVDVAATPDLFPPLAVLAACARGTTEFTGGAALRAKESDRIAAMAEGLARLGVAAQERPDGLRVTGVAAAAGGRLRGGRVRSFGDHRIHMAFSVAALAADGPVAVDGAGCEAVSFPGFHDALGRIR